MESTLLDKVLSVVQQAQETQSGIPDNLVLWIITGSSATVILATFGKSAVEIINSAGKNVPLWLNAKSQREQIEVSTIAEMKEAIGEIRKTYNEMISNLREEMMQKSEQHDREIQDLRRDLTAMTKLHDDKEVILSASASKIKELELQNAEWKEKAEGYKEKAEDYKRRLEAVSEERDKLAKMLEQYKTGQVPIVSIPDNMVALPLETDKNQSAVEGKEVNEEVSDNSSNSTAPAAGSADRSDDKPRGDAGAN